MTKTPVAAGYAIKDIQGYAIYGTGLTVDAAWAEVVDLCGPFRNAAGDDIDPDAAYETDFKTIGATAAMMAYVEANGGAVRWVEVNGVACTIDEAEEE